MISDHRTLRAEEALALYYIGTYDGENAMTIAQVREKLLPHTLEIKFIQDQGYIAEGETSRGRKMIGSAILTEGGREALRRHAGSALTELVGRIKKTTIEPERVRLEELKDRMTEMLDDLRERERDSGRRKRERDDDAPKKEEVQGRNPRRKRGVP